MEFIDLKAQYRLHQAALDRAVTEVAASARYILGPQVAELEQRLAAYVGAGQAVGLGSGSDALLAALLALGLDPGDEVICPGFTFIATAEMIVLLGGRPVFVDSEPETGNIDPEVIEAAVTNKTKGIIPVDLYGQCARLEEIEALAERLGLWVIEDGAQSFGAARNGRRALSFGDVAITSFFPAKPLGCMGDGGMAFTNDEKLAHRMRAVMNHGQTERYRHQFVGINGRLDTMQAAVLLAKLDFFDQELDLRQQAADRYQALLADIPNLELPRLAKGNTSVWAQFTIRHPDRDRLAEHLNRAGIPTAVHYPIPLNHQPVFQDLGLGKARLPVAEELSARVLSLPMHPYLTEEQQQEIAEAIASF